MEHPLYGYAIKDRCTVIYVVVHITMLDSPFPGTYTSVSKVKHSKQLRNFVSLRPMSHFDYYFFPHIADQNTDTLTSTANSSSRTVDTSIVQAALPPYSHCTPKCNKVRACLTERQHKTVFKPLHTNLCYLQKQQTGSDNLQAHVS